MDWMSIGGALLLGAMLVFLVPRLPAILRATPKAGARQWLGALVPIALVALFVLLLMQLV